MDRCGKQGVSSRGELAGSRRSYGDTLKTLISRSNRQITSNPAAAIGVRIVMVHNHPSGDPTPSKADIAVTKDIVKAAGPLGVDVHDHLTSAAAATRACVISA